MQKRETAYYYAVGITNSYINKREVSAAVVSSKCIFAEAAARPQPISHNRIN